MTDAAEALRAYDDYRDRHPGLFTNPPGSAFEILFDGASQRSAGAGVAYADPFVTVVRDAVRFRSGRVGAYVRVLPTAGHGGVVILPMSGGRIVLIRHFRHATRSWHWEVPRGMAMEGQTGEAAGRQEVREELGVQAGELRPLGSFHTDSGLTGASVDFFLTHLDRLGTLENEEGIDDVRLVTAGEFDDMVRTGEITDSFTIAAVFKARLAETP